MPDITMCKNDKCPQSDNCWRYGCPPSRYNQSYQEFIPDVDNEEEFICKYFEKYLKYEE